MVTRAERVPYDASRVKSCLATQPRASTNQQIPPLRIDDGPFRPQHCSVLRSRTTTGQRDIFPHNCWHDKGNEEENGVLDSKARGRCDDDSPFTPSPSTNDHYPDRRKPLQNPFDTTQPREPFRNRAHKRVTNIVQNAFGRCRRPRAIFLHPSWSALGKCPPWQRCAVLRRG